MDLTEQHARVLASLIEKAETTPDSYPLSTNALRAACNQATNRDPVVAYSEREVDALMLELRQFGLARTVTGAGHRVGKHKHVVDEAMGLDGNELAVLAALLLRGPQTLREIVTRTERYAHGPGGEEFEVAAAIDRLADRPEPLAMRLERRPGEREPRIVQCWVDVDDALSTNEDAAVGAATPQPHLSSPNVDEPQHDASEEADRMSELADRVAALESTVLEQRRRLDELSAELGL